MLADGGAWKVGVLTLAKGLAGPNAAAGGVPGAVSRLQATASSGRAMAEKSRDFIWMGVEETVLWRVAKNQCRAMVPRLYSKDAIPEL